MRIIRLVNGTKLSVHLKFIDAKTETMIYKFYQIFGQTLETVSGEHSNGFGLVVDSLQNGFARAFPKSVGKLRGCHIGGNEDQTCV